MKEKSIESCSVISNRYGGTTGGSMNNQMYRNVHRDGLYSSYSGRQKTRFSKKGRGVCISPQQELLSLKNDTPPLLKLMGPSNL